MTNESFSALVTMRRRRYNFASNLFPITIEALHPKTRVVVWSATVERPEETTLVQIPALSKQLGHPVAMRVRYADGTFQEEDPPVTM